jgi:hypothetical protein
MSPFKRIGRWIWASENPASIRARERQLPIWEYQWFNRVYRIAMLLGWSAVVAFFLVWNLLLANP